MFRLCRVVDVEEDSHCVVRTVEVEVRGKFVSDLKSKEYGGRKVKRICVGIQRLAVVLPIEEQSSPVTGEELLGEEIQDSEDTEINHTCNSCRCI